MNPDLLDAEITDALAELRAARGYTAHCPSAENQDVEAACERRLNRLLERRLDYQTAAARLVRP